MNQIGREPPGIFAGLGYAPPEASSPRDLPDLTTNLVPQAPDYTKFIVSGVTCGTQVTSDADLEFALDEPTTWTRISPGGHIPPGASFKRLFVRRPADVASDATKVYRVWVSHDRYHKGAPLPPKVANAGGATLGVVSPFVLAAGVPLLISRPSRRSVRVRNVGGGPPALFGPAANGPALRLDAGEEWSSDYTGALSCNNAALLQADEVY